MKRIQLIDVTQKKSPPQPKRVEGKPWKNWSLPTVEFTTNIPKRGCPVDCVFCPQRVLTKNYNEVELMSLENFKAMVDKLPPGYHIAFSGFTEPWVNKHCSDMVLYASEKGHPVSVFTTAVGMTLEDVDKIKDVPFASEGNDVGFVLHLPDQERLAKHPITKLYKKVVEKLWEHRDTISNFKVMSMGTVHEDFKHLWDFNMTHKMYSRADNLEKEKLLKPELYEHGWHWATNPESEAITCGREYNHLYGQVILPNGDVSLCCQDYGLDHILGNLLIHDFEQVIPEEFSCFELCRKCENGVNLRDINVTYLANNS